MIVDSHCHLDYDDFKEEGVDKIVERARNAGVGHFLTISTRIGAFDRVRTVAESSPHIHCSIGTHPHHAAEEQDISLEKLVDMTQHPKIAALGETGLDYYYDHSPRDVQAAVFDTHIRAGLATGLPLIIHSRDAEEDTIRQLRETGQEQARDVMHCFSGTQWLADQALDIGFYISISGIVTFKKSEELREIVKTVPVERLLVETDCPYLAPMPYRGKRNEPAYVVHTAEMVASLKGMTTMELARRTTENFFTLFDKAKAA